jgi:protein phosphatase PTC1
MAEDTDGKMHSGCTAVTAFLRIEDADGRQSFLNNAEEFVMSDSSSSVQNSPVSASFDGVEDSGNDSNGDEKEKKSVKRRSKLKTALRHLSGSYSTSSTRSHSPISSLTTVSKTIIPTFSHLRRVLYCANAGDARGVICRAGKAIRLTYDHKGSDKQEAKRIMDAGGFVMSGRVNGVLAVTRSLGDSSMKEFVVGSPYTTETELYEEDEFVILACDGVRLDSIAWFHSYTDFYLRQLWDVAEDHEAVEYVRYMKSPKEAADELVKFAKQRYSNDNVTVVVVRFRNPPEQ